MQIRDLIGATVAKLQENITVRRFARFNIREG
jgi:translation elongation factor EF-Ts